MKRHVLSLALSLAALPMATRADAQELSLRYGRPSERAQFSLTLGRPACEVPTPRFQPPRVWVAGHYETRCEEVWVPGRCRQEWVPPRYEERVTSCGRRYLVLACPGYWRTVREPGRFERREVRVWVAGYWKSQPC
jgi:hypothetical protein